MSRCQKIGRLLRDAMEFLLYPRGARCVCCGDMRGRKDDIFCPECRNAYMPMYDSAQWNNFRGVERMYSACRYRAPALDAVKAFKFSGNGYAGAFMAEEMIKAAREMGLPAMDAVVPVPLHKKRLRERGFNQSDILAEALAKELQTSKEDWLVRVKNTRKQSTLPMEERAANIADAFRAAEACKGKTILLVDDVCTSGATGHACAKALRAAGARQVELFVFADATPKQI